VKEGESPQGGEGKEEGAVERAAAARARKREQKRALKRLKIDQKKADKAKKREAKEVVRRGKSSGVKVIDEGWPVQLKKGDTPCVFLERSVWDVNLDPALRQGVPEADVASLDDLSTRSVQYSSLDTVAVRHITAVSHPACGQHGLFAAKYIPPRTRVLDYVGFVTDEDKCSTTSDFIMRLSGTLSVDAERCGNQARFINDFRRVADKPNVELVLSDGPPCSMQVWTGAEGVEAGTELLLSYGKGFWHARS